MHVGGSLANGAVKPEADAAAARKDRPTHKFNRSLPESRSV
jgi:hypothetical protein